MSPSPDVARPMANLLSGDSSTPSEVSNQTPPNAEDLKPSALPAHNPDAGKDLDTLLADLNRTPLLMTSLDETDGAGNSNPGLDALRALQYEGTASEVAHNFRNQGNECVVEKRWGDARDFYTQGIDWLAGKGRTETERGQQGRLDGGEGEAEVAWLEDVPAEERGVVDVEAEEKEQKKEGELARVNRARCNLELKNYGAAARDCAAALHLNPRNVKALYRSAQALYSLDKLDAATNAVQQTLAIDPSNVAAQRLQGQIADRAVFLTTKEHERTERARRRALEGMTLREGIMQRGWKVAGQPAADMQDAQLKLEDPKNKNSELRVPVLLVYPTAGQTELIKGIGESESLGMHLEMALPVPWDTSGADFGDGSAEKVECFIDRPEGGLSKLGKKVRLGKVLKEGKTIVAEGMVRVYVVPKVKMDDWIAEEKRRRAKS